MNRNKNLIFSKDFILTAIVSDLIHTNAISKYYAYLITKKHEIVKFSFTFILKKRVKNSIKFDKTNVKCEKGKNNTL